ncbi:MAG: isoprenyl transferase [Actinobacteria bacterium]|nr:isoprenyl transferase [Actinomycetota bacterium]
MAERSLEIPPRVAIIMDGNGRWATSRGLPRIEGHRAGGDAVVATIDAAAELGIEVLTLYAFSTENWKRPPDEVKFLMSYNEELLDRRSRKFHEKNVKICGIGRRRPLPGSLRKRIKESEELTKNNTGLKVNVAYNYGGRAEIVDAVRKIARDVAKGKLRPGAVDERLFGRYLYDPEVPDYDLLIRTAGEMRVSNFLLWEIAYAEFYVTPVLWPDFGREHLVEAIEEYNRRTRKFGGIG